MQLHYNKYYKNIKAEFKILMHKFDLFIPVGPNDFLTHIKKRNFRKVIISLNNYFVIKFRKLFFNKKIKKVIKNLVKKLSI